MRQYRPAPGTLQGRVAIVTGANSGLGLETTRLLAAAGATVIMATRDAARTATAMQQVAEAVPGADLEHVVLDLADLASVADAATMIRHGHERVNILVNNAGVMNTPLRRTSDDFELQFGVNHLGHFAFTAGVVDLMESANDPRVVTVSSLGARLGRLDFGDLNWQDRRYSAWRAYGQSKLANQVFAVELHRRLRAARSPIASLAAHPGYTSSNLSTAGNKLRGGLAASIGAAVFGLTDRIAGQDPRIGALPQVFAATSPVAASGHYYGPADLGGTRGRPTELPLLPTARDLQAGRQLWNASVDLTGAQWPFGEAPPDRGRSHVA